MCDCCDWVFEICISRLAAFQEQVAELTDIRSSKQLFLYEGAQFEVDAFLPVKSYPATTPEHPFLLLNLDLADFQHIAIPHTCELCIAWIYFSLISG